jgi:plastocyanin
LVPRQLAVLALAGALLTVALLPASAVAGNRRIAISNYQWSSPDISIDLGEHVTWYWTGPDTMHSVTGDSPNDTQLDSDPNTGLPNHDIGDSFRLDFNQPGVYKFRCKLHSTVRGTITVSAVPGDPTDEPDDVPKSNVDRRPPRLAAVHLASRHFGRRGTNLRFSMGERGKLDAEYYRYDEDGHRHFAGYSKWNAHVGFNGVRFGAHSKHFQPRPGRYLAVISATDQAQNTAKPRRVRFRIRNR